MIKGNIEEMLSVEGVYIATTVGLSMFPLLRNRKDNAVIISKPKQLKKYDVPLYRRGDDYVLHRIIDIKENKYIIRGDNCEFSETDIKDENIIGILDGVYRGNLYISVNNLLYKIYSVLTVKLHFIRIFYKKIIRCLAKIKQRIFKRSK
ncbi:MAG: hypothetical protein E7365_07225 [Clostridiales bacterium]|nr:hypothetical protein [Clostridiales bacterium]